MDDKGTLKGIICYYSGSGNTRLACQYIQGTVKSVKFDLFNITRGGIPDFDTYDVAGFATFTDFLDPPRLFLTFLEKIKPQPDKPAFVFNTYGYINGKTLYTLDRRVTARGFKAIGGHSLHMPESYPPMVAAGRGNRQAPGAKELARFKSFVSGLDKTFGLLRSGGEIKRKKAAPLAALLPSLSRTRSKRDMGIKYVDESLCDECRICKKLCPYGAVRLAPRPVFDTEKCYGCWSCFNHCPRKAIYTRKYRGIGHYPRPIDVLKDKLKV